MLQEAVLVRIREREGGTLGVAVTAAAGFAVGLLTGVVAGELLGDVNRERVKRMVARLRRSRPQPVDPAILQRAVIVALRKIGLTRRVAIRAHALGRGIVELTGSAPDEATRERAGDVARHVPGVATLINRILVEGTDLPPSQPSTVPGAD